MQHNPAIILSSRGFRENDKVVNFYTKDFGKKEILAVGARKINSKLNPHLQYFAILNISFTKGKNLDRLTSANLKENCPKIKSSLKTINLGKFCLEVVDQITKSSHPDEKIFNLLLELFNLLNNDIKIKKFENLLIPIFSIKLLSILGYTPELFICLKCKNKVIQEGNFFNFKKGGLICANCYKKDELIQPILPETIKILRLFLSEKLDIAKRIKAPKNVLEELGRISMNFLIFHLEPTRKVEQFLKWAEARE